MRGELVLGAQGSTTASLATTRSSGHLGVHADRGTSVSNASSIFEVKYAVRLGSAFAISKRVSLLVGIIELEERGKTGACHLELAELFLLGRLHGELMLLFLDITHTTEHAQAGTPSYLKRRGFLCDNGCDVLPGKEGVLSHESLVLICLCQGRVLRSVSSRLLVWSVSEETTAKTCIPEDRWQLRHVALFAITHATTKD